MSPRFFLLEKKQNATPIWPPETGGFLVQDVKPGKEDRDLVAATDVFHMTTKEQLVT